MPIKLISQDPYFVPSDEAIETVKLLMEGLAEGFQCAPWKHEKQDLPVTEITAHHCVWEKPRFVSLHESLQQVTCPACGEILELPDEVEEGEKMKGWKLTKKRLHSENGMQIQINFVSLDESQVTAGRKFKQQLLGSEDAMQLKIKMPCCDTEIAVTSIDFDSEYEGGFSRFTLSLEDYDEFNVADILLFEKILGCKLTQIHY